MYAHVQQPGLGQVPLGSGLSPCPLAGTFAGGLGTHRRPWRKGGSRATLALSLRGAGRKHTLLMPCLPPWAFLITKLRTPDVFWFPTRKQGHRLDPKR